MTRPMLLTTYSARGKGPHEFLRPQVFETLNDNNIQLYDIRTGKLYEMNIDHLADRNLELLDTLLMEFEARNAYNIKQLARGRQIATGFYPRIYNIYQPDGKTASAFGDYKIRSDVDSLAACFS